MDLQEIFREFLAVLGALAHSREHIRQYLYLRILYILNLKIQNGDEKIG